MDEDSSKSVCERLKKMPDFLWISVGVLVLIALRQAIGYVWEGHNLGLFFAVFAGGLAAGILAGRGWSFYLAVVYVVLSIIAGAVSSWEEGARALLIGLVILAPMALGRDYLGGERDELPYAGPQWSDEGPEEDEE